MPQKKDCRNSVIKYAPRRLRRQRRQLASQSNRSSNSFNRSFRPNQTINPQNWLNNPTLYSNSVVPGNWFYNPGHPYFFTPPQHSYPPPSNNNMPTNLPNNSFPPRFSYPFSGRTQMQPVNLESRRPDRPLPPRIDPPRFPVPETRKPPEPTTPPNSPSPTSQPSTSPNFTSHPIPLQPHTATANNQILTADTPSSTVQSPNLPISMNFDLPQPHIDPPLIPPPNSNSEHLSSNPVTPPNNTIPPRRQNTNSFGLRNHNLYNQNQFPNSQIPSSSIPSEPPNYTSQIQNHNSTIPSANNNSSYPQYTFPFFPQSQYPILPFFQAPFVVIPPNYNIFPTPSMPSVSYICDTPPRSRNSNLPAQSPASTSTVPPTPNLKHPQRRNNNSAMTSCQLSSNSTIPPLHISLTPRTDDIMDTSISSNLNTPAESRSPMPSSLDYSMDAQKQRPDSFTTPNDNSQRSISPIMHRSIPQLPSNLIKPPNYNTSNIDQPPTAPSSISPEALRQNPDASIPSTNNLFSQPQSSDSPMTPPIIPPSHTMSSINANMSPNTPPPSSDIVAFNNDANSPWQTPDAPLSPTPVSQPIILPVERHDCPLPTSFTNYNINSAAQPCISPVSSPSISPIAHDYSMPRQTQIPNSPKTANTNLECFTSQMSRPSPSLYRSPNYIPPSGQNISSPTAYEHSVSPDIEANNLSTTHQTRSPLPPFSPLHISLTTPDQGKTSQSRSSYSPTFFNFSVETQSPILNMCQSPVSLLSPNFSVSSEQQSLVSLLPSLTDPSIPNQRPSTAFDPPIPPYNTSSNSQSSDLPFQFPIISPTNTVSPERQNSPITSPIDPLDSLTSLLSLQSSIENDTMPPSNPTLHQSPLTHSLSDTSYNPTDVTQTQSPVEPVSKILFIIPPSHKISRKRRNSDSSVPSNSTACPIAQDNFIYQKRRSLNSPTPSRSPFIPSDYTISPTTQVSLNNMSPSSFRLSPTNDVIVPLDLSNMPSRQVQCPDFPVHQLPIPTVPANDMLQLHDSATNSDNFIFTQAVSPKCPLPVSSMSFMATTSSPSTVHLPWQNCFSPEAADQIIYSQPPFPFSPISMSSFKSNSPIPTEDFTFSNPQPAITPVPSSMTDEILNDTISEATRNFNSPTPPNQFFFSQPYVMLNESLSPISLENLNETVNSQLSPENDIYTIPPQSPVDPEFLLTVPLISPTDTIANVNSPSISVDHIIFSPHSPLSPVPSPSTSSCTITYDVFSPESQNSNSPTPRDFTTFLPTPPLIFSEPLTPLTMSPQNSNSPLPSDYLIYPKSPTFPPNPPEPTNDNEFPQYETYYLPLTSDYIIYSDPHSTVIHIPSPVPIEPTNDTLAEQHSQDSPMSVNHIFFSEPQPPIIPVTFAAIPTSNISMDHWRNMQTPITSERVTFLLPQSPIIPICRPIPSKPPQWQSHYTPVVSNYIKLTQPDCPIIPIPVSNSSESPNTETSQEDSNSPTPEHIIFSQPQSPDSPQPETSIPLVIVPRELMSPPEPKSSPSNSSDGTIISHSQPPTSTNLPVNPVPPSDVISIDSSRSNSPNNPDNIPLQPQSPASPRPLSSLPPNHSDSPQDQESNSCIPSDNNDSSPQLPSSPSSINNDGSERESPCSPTSLSSVTLSPRKSNSDSSENVYDNNSSEPSSPFTSTSHDSNICSQPQSPALLNDNVAPELHNTNNLSSPISTPSMTPSPIPSSPVSPSSPTPVPPTPTTQSPIPASSISLPPLNALAEAQSPKYLKSPNVMIVEHAEIIVPYRPLLLTRPISPIIKKLRKVRLPSKYQTSNPTPPLLPEDLAPKIASPCASNQSKAKSSIIVRIPLSKLKNIPANLQSLKNFKHPSPIPPVPNLHPEQSPSNPSFSPEIPPEPQSPNCFLPPCPSPTIPPETPSSGTCTNPASTPLNTSIQPKPLSSKLHALPSPPPAKSASPILPEDQESTVPFTPDCVSEIVATTALEHNPESFRPDSLSPIHHEPTVANIPTTPWKPRNLPPWLLKSINSISTTKARLKKSEKCYKCDTCKKKFVSRQTLTRHMKVHDLLPFICEVCKKCFQEEQQMTMHLNSHLGKPQLCEICGYTFKQLNQLNQHIYKHDDDTERPYKCEFCGSSFRVPRQLQKHLIQHEGDGPYYCNICNKDFAIQQSERNDNLIHDDEGNAYHECRICGRKFRRAITLRIHLKKHYDETPHECIVCKKRFKICTNLMKHYLVHFDERPYQCDICQTARFKTAGGLRKHFKMHEYIPERRFACELCSKRFKCKHSIKKHMKKHYRNENDKQKE
ncbi:hypothetical protein HF086_011581 [Spodoptera exigua]|uniref:C2H2-type domain-containing protein n=1 Tax=Spodoptera exigua TaxID=7107 RepID=A0A922SE33_SPOEX|nr:hypothetical protein HF086_011581 [Spodoptera exigua]